MKDQKKTQKTRMSFKEFLESEGGSAPVNSIGNGTISQDPVVKIKKKKSDEPIILTRDISPK
jgi:hypothetical protein